MARDAGLAFGLLLFTVFCVWAIQFHRQTIRVSNGYAESRISVTNREVVEKVSESTSDPEITVIFGGDIMLGRSVESRIDRFGGVWPLAELADVLTSVDLAIANLESPFHASHPQTPVDSLILRGEPAGALSLEEAGIDGVSLANNHITDMGLEGLRQTQAILKEKNIAFAGGGESQELARQPFVIERKGQKFGFLSYTYGVNFHSSGVFYAIASDESVATDVELLKKSVDVVIVLVHFGQEYSPTPTTAQQQFSHRAIDSGATLVIGSHPHVPQPLERYRNGLIAYSLGNLVFDQQPGGNRDRSALVRITFGGQRIKRADLVPYRIYDYGQPRLVTNQAEKESIWQLFNLPNGMTVF